jgi:hypothetical protein
MDFLTITAQRLADNPLFWVIVIALVLAWLDHRAQVRDLERYDAWWFTQLRRTAHRWLSGG